MDQTKRDWLRGQPLVVALDGLSVDRMLTICEDLAGLVSVVSLNTATLMAHSHMVRDLRQMGIAVFADVMLHTTSKTMADQVATLCRLGMRYITVSMHCGREARRKAVEAKREDVCLLYASMVSTVDAAEFKDSYGGDLQDFHDQCLRKAITEGADGVFIPAAALTRPLFTPAPQRTHVMPGSEHLVIAVSGVRLSGHGPGYHRFIRSPRLAVMNGASLLIIGQPIVEAESPRAVVEQIYDEIGFDPVSRNYISGRSAYQR